MHRRWGMGGDFTNRKTKRAPKSFWGAFFQKGTKGAKHRIIKSNLMKQDYAQREYNLILFCDKVGLVVHFCVHRNEPKRHLRGPFRLGPLKNPSAKRRKGVNPFGIPGEAFILTLCGVWGRKASFCNEILCLLVGRGLDLRSNVVSRRSNFRQYQSTGRDFTCLKSKCAFWEPTLVGRYVGSERARLRFGMIFYVCS